MKRLRSSAVVVAALAVLISALPVAAASPTPASGSTWEPNQDVPYRWKEGSEPPGWMRTAINSAAADSNRSRAAKAAVLSYEDGAKSWVAYTADVPSNYAIGYAVRDVPTSFTVRLRPHGFVLDWGTLRWCQFYDSPPNGCYDAEMVTLHEFGHVQTLGHVDESDVEWLDTIMHTAVHSKAKTGWNMHEYGRCDVARLQIRYAALNSSTRYSTCLSLPTSLGLSASDTSSTYGAYVTFTATLRVDPDAPYAKLAGDPVSGREVVLQRRPVGSTSWSTYVELTPLTDGSGRYAKTLRMTASYEWRARFVTPANEGLEGSSSATTKVSVSDCSSNCPLQLEPEAFAGGDV